MILSLLKHCGCKNLACHYKIIAEKLYFIVKILLSCLLLKKNVLPPSSIVAFHCFWTGNLNIEGTLYFFYELCNFFYIHIKHLGSLGKASINEIGKFRTMSQFQFVWIKNENIPRIRLTSAKDLVEVEAELGNIRVINRQ